MLVLASLHVVSRDFSDEFPCSGDRVTHKIGVFHFQVLKFIFPEHII